MLTLYDCIRSEISWQIQAREKASWGHHHLSWLQWSPRYETGTPVIAFSLLCPFASLYDFFFPYLSFFCLLCNKFGLASQSCMFFNTAVSLGPETLIKLWPKLTWVQICQVLRLLIRWCCDWPSLQQWASPHHSRAADFAVLFFLSFSPSSSPSLPCSLPSFSFLAFCLFVSSYGKQTGFWK